MLGAVKRCAEEECCAGEEHYAVASYLSGDVLDRLSRSETSSAAAATAGYVLPWLSTMQLSAVVWPLALLFFTYDTKQRPMAAIYCT